jgi:hypothetical protein
MEQPEKYWFKAKTYGWGWGLPSSWQGWVVLLLYIIFNIKFFRSIDHVSHSGSDTLMNFFLPFILSTVILMIICYLKGEKLGWRWGKK